jgi:hypothetical protein
MCEFEVGDCRILGMNVEFDVGACGVWGMDV